MPSLPRTFFNSAVSCLSTRRSARALIFCTKAISRSPRASVISACREEHSAASSVIRASSAVSRKSEGYILIARARHAATSFSEQSTNSPSGSPNLRASFSLLTSVSRESRPTAPGSRLSSASSAAPSSLPSATRASSRATPTSPNRRRERPDQGSSRRAAEAGTSRRPAHTTRTDLPRAQGPAEGPATAGRPRGTEAPQVSGCHAPPAPPARPGRRTRFRLAHRRPALPGPGMADSSDGVRTRAA
jgi:hypothetical protein